MKANLMRTLRCIEAGPDNPLGRYRIKLSINVCTKRQGIHRKSCTILTDSYKLDNVINWSAKP
jgi:hypothetical protein